MIESSAVRHLRKALSVTAYLGYSQRSQRFNRASKYYWGHQYAHLEDWEDDRPLEEKAPKVRVRLTKSAVDQVNNHLFGEGRKPSFEVEVDREETDDEEGEEGGEGDQADPLEEVNSRLSELEKRSRLRAQLPEIGRLGNLHGTVAVAFHKVSGRFDVEILHAADAYPVFGYDDRARAAELGIDFDDLLELDEYWRSVEESIDGEETEYMHRRLWLPDETVEFEKIEIEGDEIEEARDLEWTIDEERTRQHELGFVPVEWIQNRPVAHDWDGQAVVEEAEFSLEDEINYTLSQTGRGIRYNQEPQPVFSGVANATEDSPIKRGSKNALILEPGYEGTTPNAKLLEMQGAGQQEAARYIQQLHQFFSEVTQTVRHDPEQFAGALSGVALKRLLRPLVSLVGLERAQYGPALARLLEKMLEADRGQRYDVTTTWPEVVEPTPTEMSQVVRVARDAYNAGLVTLRTAVELLAPLTGIDDVDAYLDSLDDEAGRQAGGTQSAAEQAFSDAEQNLQDL